MDTLEDKTKKPLPPVPAVADPASLSQTIQDNAGKLDAGAKTIATAATAGSPDAPMPKDDQQFYLQKLQAIDNDPKFQSVAPPSTRDSLREAIQNANELYSSQSNKNDWLQVAQTLGRAVAQFGAAQQASASGNKFVGAAPMGQAIDYQAKNDRAASDRNQAIRDAYKDSELSRQDYLDADRSNKENYAMQHDYLTKGLDVSSKNAALNTSETNANRRADTSEANSRARLEQQARIDADREKQRQVFENDKMQRFETTDRRKRLDDEEKALQPQVTAGLELASDQGLKEALSNKEGDKLQTKFGALAGKANVDLTSAMNKYEELAPKKDRTLLGIPVGGILGQTTDDKTPASRQVLLDALGLTDKLDRLKQIRAERERLSGAGHTPPVNVQSNSGGPATVSSVQAPTPPSTTAPTGKVLVKDPQGRAGYIPADQLDSALKQGYTKG